MPDNTILIAETNEIIRDLFKKTLADRYPLIVVESPWYALKIIGEKKTPILVFIGIDECVNDEEENIFAVIRKQEPSLTLIALGERNEENKAIEAVRMGASGYMIKPLNPHDIVSIAAKNTPRHDTA